MALLSAALFALSVQAGMWWRVGESTIGPFGTATCGGGECRAATLEWLGDSDFWMRTGIATWAAGWIAMVVMIVIAAGVASRRVPKLAARVGVVSLAMAAVCGGYFVLGFTNRYHAMIDRGLILYVVGLFAGTGATVVVLRSRSLG